MEAPGAACTRGPDPATGACRASVYCSETWTWVLLERLWFKAVGQSLHPPPWYSSVFALDMVSGGATSVTP